MFFTSKNLEIMVIMTWHESTLTLQGYGPPGIELCTPVQIDLYTAEVFNPAHGDPLFHRV